MDRIFVPTKTTEKLIAKGVRKGILQATAVGCAASALIAALGLCGFWVYQYVEENEKMEGND